MAVLAGPEFAYRWGQTRLATPAPGAPCAVIVLGAASRELQEKRVAAGVEAFTRAGCGRMVLSGGPVHTPTPEADDMAVFAIERGLAADQVALERLSRNTWENIGNSLPLIRDYSRVYVVSDSLHAHRGLRYLCRRAPERCAKARAFGYYEPWVRPWGKIRGAWHEAGAYAKYR